MSGLAIVSGIALSMGQPVPLTLDVSASSAQNTISQNIDLASGHTVKTSKTEVAGLSQWFWQLLAPKQHDKKTRIEIDRPFRY